MISPDPTTDALIAKFTNAEKIDDIITWLDEYSGAWVRQNEFYKLRWGDTASWPVLDSLTVIDSRLDWYWSEFVLAEINKERLSWLKGDIILLQSTIMLCADFVTNYPRRQIAAFFAGLPIKFGITSVHPSLRKAAPPSSAATSILFLDFKDFPYLPLMLRLEGKT